MALLVPISYIIQARSQGGSVGADEPPSEIKVHFFKKKVHYFEEKPLIFIKGPLFNVVWRSLLLGSLSTL